MSRVLNRSGANGKAAETAMTFCGVLGSQISLSLKDNFQGPTIASNPLVHVAAGIRMSRVMRLPCLNRLDAGGANRGSGKCHDSCA